MDNPLREIMDLFGKNRLGGLKAHTLNIERAIKIMPTILVPNVKKCITLSNMLESKGVAASAPSRILASLSWLVARTGTHEVLTPAIDAKIARVKNILITVLTATP